jgi:hypothetical protein
MNTIIPPPELVQQWWEEADQYQDDPKTYFDYVATEAAQWGADQELEACCEEMKSIPSPLGIPFGNMASNALRTARRPKPPSLKEQALKTLQRLSKDGFPCNYQEDSDWDTIRRALEALPE